jgi:hypothetical protein
MLTNKITKATPSTTISPETIWPGVAPSMTTP